MTFGSPVQSHASDFRSGGGAQGWNIDQLAGLTGRPLVQLLRQHGTRSGSETVGLGTLLGPEGTGGSPLRTSDSRSRPSRWDLRVHGTAPFVERLAPAGTRRARVWNPARTLRTAQWTRASKYFVAKLIRAHGGCLGTRSR